MSETKQIERDKKPGQGLYVLENGWVHYICFDNSGKVYIIYIYYVHKNKWTVAKHRL